MGDRGPPSSQREREREIVVNLEEQGEYNITLEREEERDITLEKRGENPHWKECWLDELGLGGGLPSKPRFDIILLSMCRTSVHGCAHDHGLKVHHKAAQPPPVYGAPDFWIVEGLFQTGSCGVQDIMAGCQQHVHTPQSGARCFVAVRAGSLQQHRGGHGQSHATHVVQGVEGHVSGSLHESICAWNTCTFQHRKEHQRRHRGQPKD